MSAISIPSDWQTVNHSNVHWDVHQNKFVPILKADVIESGTDYKIHVDLPGVDPKDVEVSIHHQSVLLKAKRNYVHDIDTDRLHVFERSYGAVQRSIHLPHDAEMDRAVTEYKHGVLTVTVPKVPTAAPPRKLVIN